MGGDGSPPKPSKSFGERLIEQIQLGSAVKFDDPFIGEGKLIDTQQVDVVGMQQTIDDLRAALAKAHAELDQLLADRHNWEFMKEFN